MQNVLFKGIQFLGNFINDYQCSIILKFGFFNNTLRELSWTFTHGYYTSLYSNFITCVKPCISKKKCFQKLI